MVNETLILLTRKGNDSHYESLIKEGFYSLQPAATGARLAVCSPMGS